MQLFTLLTTLSLLSPFTAPASLLDTNEKAVLKKIAAKLNKSEWDFSVDPCSGKANWSNPESLKGMQSDVSCDCSFNNNTKCHIVSILLKGQNLSGSLPAEFSKFTYLQQLDLSRNLFTGTVPREWEKMKLLGLSFMGNKLSGTFPIALTNITTLTNLSVEGNYFNGPLPRELGKLVKLGKLVISTNGFTGEFPSSLAKLTELTDLRISSNNFSGKIPDLIGKFIKLQKLHIQGCNFKGPIPSSISLLTRLIDLRISDLRGNSSLFPDLTEMSDMKTLILRNCSIQGSIPSYIGNFDDLKHLDLSFNILNGGIPSTFFNLQRVDFIFLTGNMLTGTIPGWVLKRNKNVDISYNNFTFGNSGPTQCLEGSVNAVESYSPIVSNVSPCLIRHIPCSSSKKQYSFHINCGGTEAIINGTKFEADLEQRGASTLYLSSSNWGFSSTGNFMDNAVDADNYIVTNTSKLSMPNSELYTRARLSPLSLTYFGLCMIQGSYTVKLHFAETVFTNDATYNSLGKRLFDVFIQDKMVLENFDILEAAGGSGRAIIKTFNASVTDSSLEIKLYWAGKGTTGIPYRGYYGPLISAISVTPNFKPPKENGSSELRRRQIIIISGGVAALALTLIIVILVVWRRQHNKNSMYRELRGLDLQTRLFTLRQIKAATKNFDPVNKLGEGGFGSVYKGLLADGTVIAVKQLSSRSRQGNQEFITELGVISALQHPNLVKLYGCCAEGNQLLLIYEYMENNSLAHALFSKDPQQKQKLDWPTRRKICLDVARGLAYLHEESILKIVHRDIKGSNILLDKGLNAKISDFGLAKLDEQDHTHISTRVAGTIGYMAPEYAMRGHLTHKADIYSFGVVVLEIVSGKSNTNYRPKDEFVYLLDWACVLHERGTLLELVDPDLGSEYSKEEALMVLKVGLLCTNSSPTLRPTISQVVKLLEGKASLQPFVSNLSLLANVSSSNGFRRNFWQNPSESQTVSITVKSPDQSDPASERLLI